MDQQEASSDQEVHDFVNVKLREQYPYMKTDITNAIAQKCKAVIADGVAAQ